MARPRMRPMAELSTSTHATRQPTDQRRRVRRNALLLLSLAAGVYFAFIAFAITRGLHGH
jgi:hypothetical protein